MPSIQRIVVPTSFAEGSVNSYLLLGEPLTLVDCGTGEPGSLAALQAALAGAGAGLSDLQCLVLTHLHWNHCGGLAGVLQAAPGIEVVAHQRALPGLCGGAAEQSRQAGLVMGYLRAAGMAEADLRSWAEPRPAPALADPARVRWLREGDRIEGGGGVWDVLHTPGHSQTEVCLHDPESGALIAGDHLLPDISANTPLEAPGPGGRARPRALLQLREHLGRVRALEAGTVYPGHGEPFTGHRALIDRRLLEQDHRCASIAAHLAQGPLTAVEVSRRLFPRLQGRGVFLGISEAIGHLDLLEARGQVRTRGQDGVLRYELVGLPAAAGRPGNWPGD